MGVGETERQTDRETERKKGREMISLHWGGILTERALSKFPDEPTEITDSEESQTFLNRILWQNMENRESISCFIHVLGCANIG